MKLLTILLTVCLLSGCSLSKQFIKEGSADKLLTFYEENQINKYQDDSEVLTSVIPVPAPVETVPVEEIKTDKLGVDKWLTVDVSEWAETCHIEATCTSSTLTIKADKIPSNWPVFSDGLRATIGIIITIDGKRYGSTFEFTRGSVKNFPVDKLGPEPDHAPDHLQGYRHLNGWYWKKGEEIEVFFIANNTRAGHDKVKERSNVVKVRRG